MNDNRLRITLYAPAPDGTIYLETAAEGVIGRETPIKVFDDPVFIGTIEEAKVVDDGKVIVMTVSVRNMPPELRKMLENGAKRLADA